MTSCLAFCRMRVHVPARPVPRESMKRNAGTNDYGSLLEVTEREKSLIDTYYVVDEGLEDSLRITKRRTRAKRQQNALGAWESYVYLLKGNIGSGILALPQAFSYGGYALSTAFMILIGILSIHCMVLLVNSVHFIVNRWNLISLEYGQVSEWAFLNLSTTRVNFGCCRVRKAVLGRLAKLAVNIFLIVTQFGFGIVYFVLMANTLDNVVRSMGYDSIPLRAWVVVLLVPMVVLSWIREMKSLSPLVLLANICVVLVLLVIFYDIVSHLVGHTAAVGCNPEALFNSSNGSALVCGGEVVVGCGVSPVNTTPIAFKQVFLFLSIAVYAFEGIGVVLPLENKMKNPEQFHKVLYGAMGTVMAMFIAVGLLGYLTYGHCVQDNVTQNLTSEITILRILYLSVQLYMGYVIYISFATAFYVPMDFLEPPLLDRLNLADPVTRRGKFAKTVFHTVFRSATVFLLCCLALIEPDHLADFISLVGAFASTALALIFPPIIHVLVFAFGGTSSGLTRHLRQPTGVSASSDGGSHIDEEGVVGHNRREHYNPIDVDREDSDDDGDDNDSDLGIGSKPATPLIRKQRLKCLRYWWVAKDLLISCIGVVCAVIGTYAAMESLIEGFK